jgi:hypothetical protein
MTAITIFNFPQNVFQFEEDTLRNYKDVELIRRVLDVSVRSQLRELVLKCDIQNAIIQPVLVQNWKQDHLHLVGWNLGVTEPKWDGFRVGIIGQQTLAVMDSSTLNRLPLWFFARKLCEVTDFEVELWVNEMTSRLQREVIIKRLVMAFFDTPCMLHPARSRHWPFCVVDEEEF